MKAIAAILAVLALCACSGHSIGPARAGVPARRIVALMPSLTEDLCAIGAREQLAGVSVYSEDIGKCTSGVPVVANFTSVDTERVVQLHPDVVVGIPSQAAMTEPLRRAGIRTAFFKGDSYDDLFHDIASLGALSGHTAQARILAANLHKRTSELRASEHFKRHPNVFFVIQALPIWTVGPQSYITTLVEFAGGRNAVRSLPQAYAQYSPEALVRLQPDIIVATRDARIGALLAREPWRSLRAVREHRVFTLSDDSIVVRPGPRYNEGLQWLIERFRAVST